MNVPRRRGKRNRREETDKRGGFYIVRPGCGWLLFIWNVLSIIPKGRDPQLFFFFFFFFVCSLFCTFFFLQKFKDEQEKKKKEGVKEKN